MTNLDNIVTSSSISKAQNCLALYDFSMNQCLWPVTYQEPDYFVDGRGFHEWLETGKRPPMIGHKEAKLNGIIDAYSDHYTGHDFATIGYQAEHMFMMDSILGYKIAGIIDGIDKSVPRLWEHKLVQDISGSFLDKLSISLQRIYAVATGIDAIMFNVVQKPQLRLKQSEEIEAFRARIKEEMLSKPDKYFCRQVVRITPWQMKDVREYFEYWIANINQAHELNNWPRNYGSCFGMYGQRCMYFEICTSEDKEFVIRERFVRLEDKRHEELKRRMENGLRVAD